MSTPLASHADRHAYEAMVLAFAPGWLSAARERREQLAGDYYAQSHRTKVAVDQKIIEENR